MRKNTFSLLIDSIRSVLHKENHGQTEQDAMFTELRDSVANPPLFAGETCCQILFSIKDHSLYSNMYGKNFTEQLELDLVESVRTEIAALKHGFDGSVMLLNSGEVLTFWSTQGTCDDNLIDLAYSLKTKLKEALTKSIIHRTGLSLDLGIGCSKFLVDKTEDGNACFFSGLQEARRSAQTALDFTQLQLSAEFENIVTNRNIASHFQPIIDFQTGNIYGWEALVRGPMTSHFRSPMMLFEFAEQLGRLFELERLCREKALTTLGELPSNQRIFLNIHPKTMSDPAFTPGKTLELLKRCGLSPANVVFEITEQHSVHDFGLFHRTLEHYRNQGFMIAVDDAGAGYSGLRTIAELQPEYIKMDKSLIWNIHRDPVKRALVETTVTFADKIGSKIIAEGIETRDQAICAIDIGVHFGQGYYFGKPDYPKPGPNANCIELKSFAKITNVNVSCSIPVGELAEAPHVIPPEYPVKSAQSFFMQNMNCPSLVVADDNIPVGLVMEYHLNRQLSSQYGVALYSHRAVEDIMDAKPLCIEYGTPVENAAHLAMERESMKAYDEVIVTKKGELYGVVSVQKLLNTLARVQVEMAKGTNPLTGLPGNVALEMEVDSRLSDCKPFCLIYADLDHFKVYNDTYGFKNGDRIIRLAADILQWALKKYAPKHSILCHIGGDDFVMICNPEHVERVCRGVLRCFERLVKYFYSESDRSKGWISARGRDGLKRDYPLVSISLGVIEIVGKCTLMEIGERAADIKKFAKSKPGNTWAKDRRPPLGSEAAKTR